MDVILNCREIKIDCIIINTAPLKHTIDDLIQRLFDALLSSLRRAATKDMEVIDEFLAEAIDALTKRPATMEELSGASVQYKEYSAKKAKVGSTHTEIICYF